MKDFLLSAAVILSAATGHAQDFKTSTLSDLSGSLKPETSEERFVSAGVHFLRAVEIILQARYDYGLAEEMAGLPVLRLGIGENPEPKPVPEGVIGDTLKSAEAELSRSKELLAGLPKGEAFVSRIPLDDLWLDVNSSGARDEGEGVLEVLSTTAMLPQAQQGVVIGFDNADAAWLDAYASLLTGVSKTIRAYDPDSVLSEVLESRKLFSLDAPSDQFIPSSFIDAAAVVIGTLKNAPDQVLGREARASFLDVVSSNKEFLEIMGSEADDDQEWIPNHNQRITVGALAFSGPSSEPRTTGFTPDEISPLGPPS